MRSRVAIVGGGSSGVIAAKILAESGFTDIVCFERRDAIGGLWHFTDKKPQWIDEGRVNKGTVLNTSKEIMALSDFPMPENYPNFSHHTLVDEYLNSYAKHFEIYKYVKLNAEVASVKQHGTFESTGRWEVAWRDVTSDDSVVEIFDFVLIANGWVTCPKVPNFPGLENFKGKTIHSKEFTNSAEFSGMKCCVVGLGNSSVDVAMELSSCSTCRVVMSLRRGLWIQNRLGLAGKPYDHLLHSRFRWFVYSLLPRNVRLYLWRRKFNATVDHEVFGLSPPEQPDASHPIVFDDLPHKIACGRIRIKPNIRKFTRTGIVFEDGSFEDNVDLVVFATGYTLSMPFFKDSNVMELRESDLKLYKHMWVPGLSQQTLAFVGSTRPLGASFPTAELQARLVARVFKGEMQLPSEEEMRKDIARFKKDLEGRYVGAVGYSNRVDYLPHLDELAGQVGCKPNLVRYLLFDPVLFWHLMFGPGVSYQYRLDGPHTWPGARKAILTVTDRTCKSFGTFKATKTTSKEIGLSSTKINIWYLWLMMCFLLTGLSYAMASAF
ncbi:hypothetical protein RRG08_051966 [Elysia crispata]|uniref:Flavin-containing monooxygenase n=1 Tax=Elysia crispata TaxID=231223 RepID=A0AAE0ZDC2_9GAST|nr:hypothetical protein RRG08_051966 [Elysia crispata]